MPRPIRTRSTVEESNCVACDRPDDADKCVQCDACDSWWHFSCAKVTDSISDRSWTCVKCAKDGSLSFKSGVSGRSGSQLAESMARLKERQELERKQLELDLQKKFLDEQQRLLDATVVEIAESAKSRVSRHDSLIRVEEWVLRNAEQDEGAMNAKEPLAASQPQQLQPVLKFHCDTTETLNRRQEQRERCHQQPNVAQDVLQHLQNQLEECKKQIAGLQLPIRSGSELPLRSLGAIPKTRQIMIEQDWRTSSDPRVHSAGNYEQHRDNHVHFGFSANQKQRDERARVEFDFSANMQQQNERALFDSKANEQLREPYVRDGNMNPPGPFSQANTQEYRNPLIQGPTHQQLAARQSLARDLPTFSGDPSEWPIFISNYNYTTAACGYMDGENMVRLQRCLKGQALEMVRNRLVLPAVVPSVIETLRMRYGRPEVLINTLLQKVRSIPIPKSEKLEGLIEYGLVVQAMCEHIEAANEHAHLSNPTLLQELVNKLPAEQKMMWAGYKRDVPAASINLRTFGDYMAGIVRDASSVVLFEPENIKATSREKVKPKGYVNSHTPGTSEETPVPRQYSCLCCSEVGHYVRDCEMFINFNVDERWRKIRELRLCQNCLFGQKGRS